MKCLLFSLLGLSIAIASPPALAAQRPPTIAAAANLNFALTEIADQFARERGTRVELVFGASGTLTRQIQDGAPFEMFLAADEEFPNQLTAAGLTRDAGVVYAVGRLVIFAPTGFAARPSTSGSTAWRAWSRPAASAGSRSPIPTSRRTAGPPRRCCGSAGCGTRSGRSWCSATPSRRPRSSPRPATPSAASSRTRSCSARGSRDRGTYAVIPEADHPPLRQRMVLLKRAGPASRRSSTQYLQSERARAILRKHGYGVPQ